MATTLGVVTKLIFGIDLVEEFSSPPPVEPPVVETVSVDEARDLINPLSRPLAEVTNTLISNLAKVEECLAILKQANSDEERLQACLYRNVEVLETAKLDHPRTVCTAKECTNIVGEVIEYSTICHDRCTLQNVPHDTIGHHTLKDCYCINKKTFHCHVGKCRCSYLLHQHITYSSRRKTITIKDEAVEKLINGKRSTKQIVKATLAKLRREIEELQAEKKKISTASARFAVFLKEHANDVAPFIDMLDRFLESMIEQRRNTNDVATTQGLEKLRQEYQDEQKYFENKDPTFVSAYNKPRPTVMGWIGGLFWTKAPPPRPLRPSEVPPMVEELENLPRYGISLKLQLEAQAGA